MDGLIDLESIWLEIQQMQQQGMEETPGDCTRLVLTLLNNLPRIPVQQMEPRNGGNYLVRMVSSSYEKQKELYNVLSTSYETCAA